MNFLLAGKIFPCILKTQKAQLDQHHRYRISTNGLFYSESFSTIKSFNKANKTGRVKFVG